MPATCDVNKNNCEFHSTCSVKLLQNVFFHLVRVLLKSGLLKQEIETGLFLFKNYDFNTIEILLWAFCGILFTMINLKLEEYWRNIIL